MSITSIERQLGVQLLIKYLAAIEKLGKLIRKAHRLIAWYSLALLRVRQQFQCLSLRRIQFDARANCPNQREGFRRS